MPRLRNDIVCVEWDAKTLLSLSLMVAVNSQRNKKNAFIRISACVCDYSLTGTPGVLAVQARGDANQRHNSYLLTSGSLPLPPADDRTT